MRLYLANGQYVGTQAEAKKIDRSFEQVEVPTDKEGLIDWLNQARLDVDRSGEKVELYPTDADVAEVKRIAGITEVVPPINYANRSIAIDEVIEAAELGEAASIAARANERVLEHLRLIADAKWPQPKKGYAS